MLVQKRFTLHIPNTHHSNYTPHLISQLAAKSLTAYLLVSSASGRENFLAAEADRALAEMCKRASEHRAVAVLCANANHKSTHVRAKVGDPLWVVCTSELQPVVSQH